MNFASLRRAAPLALPMLLFAWERPAPAQEAPVQITTDTMDYCIDLARRTAELTAQPESARQLSEEGRSLCEHGKIRAGIARLRRALMATQQGAGDR